MNNVVVFNAKRGRFMDRLTSDWRDGTYGKACKTDDIIEICLNLNEETFSLSINDQYQVILSRNIQKGQKYRMAVSICGFDASLKLISFRQLNTKKCSVHSFAK